MVSPAALASLFITLRRQRMSHVVEIEARRQGHTVTEQSLADGSIKLTINIGGAA
jgi:hypothetical protein